MALKAYDKSTDPTIPKRVAIYTRASTSEQVASWFWLDSQVRICKAFVESNENKGWVYNPNLIYQDEGISGATTVAERPALSRLRNDIIAWKIDVVATFKLDRLFRKTALLLDFIEFLTSYDVVFASKDENIDLSSSTWKIILTFFGWIGELERDTITLRTSEGKLSKAMQGYFVYWRSTPYGYSLEHDGRGNKMVINEKEAEIVKQIFELYVKDNRTSGYIAKYMTDLWVWTSRDTGSLKGKPKIHTNLFRQSNIVKMLRSSFYSTGSYVANKNTYRKKDWKIEVKPKDSSLQVSIPCPKIVKESIFLSAQEKLGKAQVLNGKGERHLFTWLLKCWYCWRSMAHYRSSKGTSNYRCVWRNKTKVSKENVCKCKDISEERALSLVWVKIEQFFDNPHKFLAEYEKKHRNEEALEAQMNELKRKTQETKRDLDENYQLKKNAILQKLKDQKNETIYLDIINDLEKQEWALIQKMQKIQAEITTLNEYTQTKKAVLDLYERYKQELKPMRPNDRQKYIDLLIDKIQVFDDRLEYWMRFEME